ncbi:hypothetical protein [Arcobacter sp. FWKO B]|uniref:hypothetical protein n=1 Tax=Arcobacter sp. FWKO B TaxID=2593672 RepID=UPI0018A3F1F7|nr:hypothetical protein [Arcobacter sp. FWKO B]QOG11939.1 hypothetical protein FWKOB_04145 [Arcobacter sp. FWKO B]
MKKLVGVFLLLFFSHLFASSSCYQIYKTSVKPSSEINTAVFVLIDETTLFDDKLKQQVISNVVSKIAPANYVYIAKFSAFIDGHYNEKVFDFLLDVPLTNEQRHYERKDVLGRVDKCLKDQGRYVFNQVNASIMNSFLVPGNDIAKSDILYALQDFGINVISQTEASEKIVILVSDMLENSTISSFYSKGTARLINPSIELQKVDKENLFSDFGGAKVYIIGAGIVPTNLKAGTYRDPKILASLKNFWEEYFQQSNANLIEMGQPALKQPVR